MLLLDFWTEREIKLLLLLENHKDSDSQTQQQDEADDRTHDDPD